MHSPLRVLMILKSISDSGSNSESAIGGHAVQQFPQALHRFSLIMRRNDMEITIGIDHLGIDATIIIPIVQFGSYIGT